MTVTGADGVPRSVWDAAPARPSRSKCLRPARWCRCCWTAGRIGRKLADRDAGGKAVFPVEFRPGTLEAVCFHRGYEQARISLYTPAAAAGLKVTPQTAAADMATDGLAYFSVEAGGRGRAYGGELRRGSARHRYGRRGSWRCSPATGRRAGAGERPAVPRPRDGDCTGRRDRPRRAESGGRRLEERPRFGADKTGKGTIIERDRPRVRQIITLSVKEHSQ